MATNVGSIEATLTLDRSPFSRELQLAKAEAAEMEAKHYTVHFDADVDRAHRALQTVDGDAKKVEKSTTEASKGGSLLVNSLIALGPAAVPLAAVAATVGAGFVAAGGVAVLALLGIKNAIKDNTALGQAYRQQLQGLNTDLRNLEGIAAKGVFQGLQQGVAALHSLMPALSTDTRVLSVQLGHIASDTVVGLVSLFHQLNPLLTGFGNSLETGAAKFRIWASSSTSVKGFIDYARANLPLVLKTLGDLSQTLIHITQAGAPLGPVVVKALDDIAVAINKIPIPVLTAFIAALQVNRLLSMAGGVKGLGEAFSGLSGKLGTGLTALGAFIQGTGGIAGALGPVALGIAAVGAASLYTTKVIPALGFNINNLSSAGDSLNKIWGKATTTFQDQVTQAFQTGGASAQELAGKAVIAAAGMDQVKQILFDSGKTANDFTTAITGTNTQFDRFIESVKNSQGFQQGIVTPDDLDRLRKLRNAYVDGSITGKQMADAAEAVNKAMSAPNLPTFSGSLAEIGKQFGLSATEAQRYAGIAGITKDAIDNGQLSNQQLANAVHLVAHAYNEANVSTGLFLDAMEKFSKSAGTAADRAALIGATLVAAQGDSLSFAGSMNAAYVASHNLGTQVGTLASKVVNLKTGQIDYTNAAAAPLIQALDQMQSSAMGAAEAMFLHEKGTKTAKVAADDAFGVFQNLTYGALVGQAKQLGLTHDQAVKLADSYFSIKNSGDIKKKIEEEGGATVLDVLHDIDHLLRILDGLDPKPTVGPPHDKITIPLSAIDQHLGLVGSRNPHPTVNVNDRTGQPLSAIDQHLGLVGSRRPRPPVDVNDRASGPLSTIDSRISHVAAHNAQPYVNVADHASGVLSTIDYELSAINGRVATATVVTVYKAVVQPGAPAPGGHFISDKGNIFKYYGVGGLDVPNGHQATIAPKGATRVWAEPETDGEAYIPYRRDTRDRSERILAQVASDFGLRVTRAVDHYANGAVVAPTPGTSNVRADTSGGWSAVLLALQALLVEMRAMRANSDPWKVHQIAKMHERTR